MSEDKSQDSIKDLFTKELKANNLRKTPERYAILEVVSATSKPFDIKYISEKMQGGKFVITLQTIYNTLALLERCKIIRSYKLKGNTLYEKGIEQQIYVNLICDKCGKVTRRKDPTLSQTIMEKRYGRFNSSYHTLNIHGECNACATKSRKEQQNSKSNTLKRGQRVVSNKK